MQRDAVHEPDSPRQIHRRNGQSLVNRFWTRVDTSAGLKKCWPWMGSVNPRGYGQIRLEPEGNAIRGKKTTTHRVAWMLANGAIPEGMHVCHKCDTPLCVNPAHLWLGTHAENLADMKAKGRAARGERSGTARLNGGQVRLIKQLLGAGVCSTSELSVLAGVTKGVIDAIKYEKTWRHINA